MKSINYLLFVLLLSAIVSRVSAQDENLRYEDYIYVDNIFSLKFHIEGLALSYPVVDLNNGPKLFLTFDDLDGDTKDYFYTIVHCDANWERSDLQEMEYLDGFTEERINDFSFSFKTFWPYTHYELTLPNRDISWTKPGNYLLKVYDDTDERKLVLTRRFVVVDNQVKISPRMVRAAQVSQLRTHQEIDFTVNFEDLRINNPQQELRATILQNGRWDNAITGLPPMFIRPDQAIFDHQGKVVFPGGKEFRFVDLRSLRRVHFNVASVEQTQDGFLVQMKPEQRRDQLSYTTFNDLNGKFVIQTNDQPNGNLSSEYVYTLFTLVADYQPDLNIYLYGAFTDWRAQDYFRMEYDPRIEAYVGEALLKQGYYDYAYAGVPKVSNSKRGAPAPVPDLAYMEGNSNEAFNEYTIIIYHRPFGSRYDIPVGTLTFSSNIQN